MKFILFMVVAVAGGWLFGRIWKKIGATERLKAMRDMIRERIKK